MCVTKFCCFAVLTVMSLCRIQKLQKPDGKLNHMQLVGSQVMLVDSVNGDGSSVKALSNTIFEVVSKMPMMKELIPSKWAKLRQIVQQSYQDGSGPLAGKSVLQKQEVVKLLASLGWV